MLDVEGILDVRGKQLGPRTEILELWIGIDRGRFAKSVVEAAEFG